MGSVPSAGKADTISGGSSTPALPQQNMASREGIEPRAAEYEVGLLDKALRP